MIKLFTDIKLAPSETNWVMVNDAFFDANIAVKKLNKRDKELMYEIEGIKTLDNNSDAVMSRTGIITINEISTGLKTLLNIRFLKRNIERVNKPFGVNITECGKNVLDYVFEEVKGGSMFVLLRHFDVLGLKNRYIEVNGDKRVKTMDALFELL